jgi:hypothetical protein
MSSLLDGQVDEGLAYCTPPSAYLKASNDSMISSPPHLGESGSGSLAGAVSLRAICHLWKSSYAETGPVKLQRCGKPSGKAIFLVDVLVLA